MAVSWALPGSPRTGPVCRVGPVTVSEFRKEQGREQKGRWNWGERLGRRREAWKERLIVTELSQRLCPLHSAGALSSASSPHRLLRA